MSPSSPSWQTQIHHSLLARDTHEKSQTELIRQYNRLANQTLVLKERNGILLRAAHSGTGNGNGNGNGKGGAGGGGENPVRLAYLNSLESQIQQTKLELSEQYKIQSSNAQRLLALTDNLREVEERGRDERDELRKLRTEVEGLREKARWHREVVEEKERQLIILQDDNASLDLELSQLNLQNEALKTDNSSLLQRWLESKNHEVALMNQVLEKEESEAKETKLKTEKKKEKEQKDGLLDKEKGGKGKDKDKDKVKK